MKKMLILLLLINSVYAQVTPITIGGQPATDGSGTPLYMGEYLSTVSDKIFWLDYTKPQNVGYYKDASNNIIKPLDLTGVTNIDAQGTVANRALLVTNQINGLSIARYSTAVGLYTFTTPFTYAANMTIVTVCKINAGNQRMWVATSSINYTDYYVSSYAAEGTGINNKFTSNASRSCATINPVTSFNITITVITSAIPTFYKNGLLYCTGLTINSGGAGYGTFNNHGYRAVSTYSSADLAEVCIITHASSSLEIGNIFLSLSQKYAIALYTETPIYFNPLEQKEFRSKDMYASSITNYYDSIGLIYKYNNEAIKDEEIYS